MKLDEIKHKSFDVRKPVLELGVLVILLLPKTSPSRCDHRYQKPENTGILRLESNVQSDS